MNKRALKDISNTLFDPNHTINLSMKNNINNNQVSNSITEKIENDKILNQSIEKAKDSLDYEIEYLQYLISKIDETINIPIGRELNEVSLEPLRESSTFDSYITCDDFSDTNDSTHHQSSSSSRSSRKRKRKSEIIICCTGLTSSELRIVQNAASKLQAIVVKEVTEKVTHLVTNISNDKSAKRTVKFILGIVNHCWILDLKWVICSIERNQWLQEEEFEVIYDQYGFKDGPRKSRVTRKPLFSDYTFYIGSPFKNGPNKKEINSFIEGTGGLVSTKLKKGSIIIYHEQEGPNRNLLKYIYEGYSILSHQWVVDSISEYTIRDMNPYIYRK